MHTLIVMAHPAAASLTRTLADAIRDAVLARGHTADIADLVAERFDPAFGLADHAAFNGRGPLPDAVLAEQRRIDNADHLVLVFPVYWWSMPALLKGWIDRVFVAGWAFDENADGSLVKRLGRLNVHLVAVAGASQATYAKRGYREAMRVQIEHGIFDFCGAPVLTSDLIESQDVDAVAVAAAADAIARHLPEATSRAGG